MQWRVFEERARGWRGCGGAGRMVLVIVAVGLAVGCNPFNPRYENVACGVEDDACPVGLICDPWRRTCGEVSVVFPPPSSLTTADSVTVRGELALDSAATEVRVNGALASLVPGEEAMTWQVSVPLGTGENRLDIVAAGVERVLTYQVWGLEGPFLQGPDGIVVESARNRALIVDPEIAVLVAIDLDTAAQTVISDATRGTGPMWTNPVEIALDSANDRALVLDLQVSAGALFTVDLRNGNRAVVSSDLGPSIIAVAAEPGRDRGLLLDRSRNVLEAIDLASGERVVISGSGVGAGPEFMALRNVVVLPGGTHALVSDEGLFALLEVDLVTGDRRVISDGATGAGDGFLFPGSLAIDDSGDRVLVLDAANRTFGLRDEDRLVAVDLATGDRTVLSEKATEADFPFFIPRSLAIDGNRGRALIVDSGAESLMIVDLESGNRQVFSEVEIGGGLTLGSPSRIGFDVETGILVIDELHRAIMAIESGTGDRAVLVTDNSDEWSSRATSTILGIHDRRILLINGTEFLSYDLDTGSPRAIALAEDGDGPAFGPGVRAIMDVERERILTADSAFSSLISIPLVGGPRTVVSGPERGAGSALSFARALVPSERSDEIFVLSGGEVVHIDLESGDRTAVTVNPNGDDFPLARSVNLISDVENGRLYADDRDPIEAGIQAIVEIDRDNGERIPRWDLATGKGPNLDRVRSFVPTALSGLILFAAEAPDGILVLDPETGEVVLFSR